MTTESKKTLVMSGRISSDKSNLSNRPKGTEEWRKSIREELENLRNWNIIYSPPLGSHIEDVIRIVLAEAQRMKKTLSFIHNGTQVYVKPEDSYDTVFESWSKPRPT